MPAAGSCGGSDAGKGSGCGSGSLSSSGRSSDSSDSAVSGGESPVWSAESSCDWVGSIPLADGVRERELRILLPCAGWDAPSRALRALKVPHRAAGMWEISEPARAVLQKLHCDVEKRCLHLGPNDGDVMKVDMASLPEADLLISGPPCPPWSSIGKRRRSLDPRASVFDTVVSWILRLARRSLKCFILENVTGMTHRTRSSADEGLPRCSSSRGKSRDERQIVTIFCVLHVSLETLYDKSAGCSGNR